MNIPQLLILNADWYSHTRPQISKKTTHTLHKNLEGEKHTTQLKSTQPRNKGVFHGMWREKKGGRERREKKGFYHPQGFAEVAAAGTTAKSCG